LVLGRFILALGSGVGLKMTYTLVNESYEPKVASQKISYLVMAFAIMPGISVALGGILNTYYGWTSCFYVSALYGLLLLVLLTKLPETQKILDLNAFKIKHLLHSYSTPFKNMQLIAGGLLMGGSACFVYVFAALAPFIAINLYGMNSAQYGMANILPPIGLILGALLSAKLTKQYSLNTMIQIGLYIAGVGVTSMIIAIAAHLSVVLTLFAPMVIIYFGLSLIIPNASVLAMNQVIDKAHGSSVMNFINMGFATLVTLSLGFFPINMQLLPIIYIVLCAAMLVIFKWQKYRQQVR
jgi:MFS family permease